MLNLSLLQCCVAAIDPYMRLRLGSLRNAVKAAERLMAELVVKRSHLRPSVFITWQASAWSVGQTTWTGAPGHHIFHYEDGAFRNRTNAVRRPPNHPVQTARPRMLRVGILNCLGTLVLLVVLVAVAGPVAPSTRRPIAAAAAAAAVVVAVAGVFCLVVLALLEFFNF